MAIKSEKEIVMALSETMLSQDENEMWDGEPEMYINRGWEEALTWVLNDSKLLKRYNLKMEENFNKLMEELDCGQNEGVVGK